MWVGDKLVNEFMTLDETMVLLFGKDNVDWEHATVCALAHSEISLGVS